MIKVYFASKLSHAPLHERLRNEWSDVHFVSRWWLYVDKIEDAAHEAEKFWEDDLADIDRADVVLVYARPEDRLRGALVEVGYAIARGKMVLLVGDHPDYGTWQHHSSVERVVNLEDAHARLTVLEDMRKWLARAC